MSDVRVVDPFAADPQLAGDVDAVFLNPSTPIELATRTAERDLGEGRGLFARLYVAYRPSIAAQAGKYLNDRRDVDEVVQETFLKLLLALPDLETEGQALAWCRRTVTNACIDRYRAAGRRPILAPLEEMPVDFGATVDDDPVIAAEDAAIVREALARLSPQHRQALIMREIEERPLAEIAVALAIPEEQVKHVLHRARRSMRRLLADSPLVRVTALIALVASVLSGGWAAARFTSKPQPTIVASASGVPTDTLVDPSAAGPSDVSNARPPHFVVAPAKARRKPVAKKASAAPAIHAPVFEGRVMPTLSTALIAPAPVLMAPVVAAVAQATAIVNTPFVFRDDTTGAVSRARVAQHSTWIDNNQGTDASHALTQLDAAGIGMVVLGFTQNADTTSSSTVGLNLNVNGAQVPMAVGDVASSVTHNDDGTLLVVEDVTLNGLDTAGNSVSSPLRLQVATVYSADLGHLISSRFELSPRGTT